MAEAIEMATFGLVTGMNAAAFVAANGVSGPSAPGGDSRRHPGVVTAARYQPRAEPRQAFQIAVIAEPIVARRRLLAQVATLADAYAAMLARDGAGKLALTPPGAAGALPTRPLRMTHRRRLPPIGSPGTAPGSALLARTATGVARRGTLRRILADDPE